MRCGRDADIDFFLVLLIATTENEGRSAASREASAGHASRAVFCQVAAREGLATLLRGIYRTAPAAISSCSSSTGSIAVRRDISAPTDRYDREC